MRCQLLTLIDEHAQACYAAKDEMVDLEHRLRRRARLWRRRLSYNWSLFRTDRLGVVGLAILGLFMILGILHPILLSTVWDPEIYDPINGFDWEEPRPPPAPPSLRHLLGTDIQGRDVLSQLLYSIRIELMLGVLAAVVAALLGTAIGVLAAYFHGKLIDTALMRLTNLFLVLPPVAFILFLGTLTRLNIPLLALLIGAIVGGKVAIIMKARALEVVLKPYVSAARVIGGRSLYIIWRHVLPNVIPYAFLFMMFSSVTAVLAEALLSFYGGGYSGGLHYGEAPMGFIQMSWGLMLYLAYYSGYFMGDNVIRYWWLSFPAGFAVTLLSSAFYFLGRGFNQIANPKLGGVR